MIQITRDSQAEIDKTTASIKMVCASCGSFITSGMDNATDKIGPLFEVAIRSRVFSEAGFGQRDIIKEDSAIFCDISFATIAAS